MDKSKRASSSALYERTVRSPTEAFYNATGSTRLSSQELFEKFCSEDFTSLYGREENCRRKPPHSKSTGSSGSDVRACCRRVVVPGAATVVGAGGSQPTLGRRGPAPRSDRSTDSEDASPAPAPRPLPLHPANSQTNACSRSAPLLSPDRFEAHFTFDISERSEVTSCHDDTTTPSDATETRNLTLYEEPHSDRTSICELYDAAFSSQRPSFRRDGSRRRGAGPFDLSMLDFRAIDDESPSASRRASQRSANDTLRQNSESRSWASDSVFNTPERRPPTTSPSSVDTRRTALAPDGSQRADSTLLDTTVADEEPSIIERSDYALALSLGRITIEDNKFETESGRTECPEGGRMSSRASMHKLKPLDAESIGQPAAGERRRRGASEPRRSAGRCFPL